MKYIPFPVDEVLAALADLVREHRDAFSPNLATVDLDEFFGLGLDLEDLPDAFAIVRPDDGDLGTNRLGVSDDLVKASVVIYSRLELDAARSGSLVLLRQLIQVLRSIETADSLTIETKSCQINWIRPTGYAPDNQFFNENYSGWSVSVEIGLTNHSIRANLPTY